MNISFEDAARGAQKSMDINVVDDCPACFGKGVQPGYKKVYVVVVIPVLTYLELTLFLDNHSLTKIDAIWTTAELYFTF